MEVPVVGSDAIRWTQLKVPASFGAAEPCCPPSRDSAGKVALGAPSFRHIIWRIHKSFPAVLELFELDDQEAQKIGLQLVFEEPLCPFATVFIDQVNEEKILCVSVVSISGVMYRTKVKAFHEYRHSSVLAKSETVQFCLSSELLRFDQITSFAAVAETFCVGGKNGSIVCYPSGQLNEVVKDLSFELKDGDARFGRLWGLVTRGKTAGPIQSLSIKSIQDRLTLFALHGDGTFRVWDLCDRCRILNFNLNRAELAGFTPKMMWVQESGLERGSLQIAFLFRSLLENGGETIHIYDLHLSHADGGMRQVLLTHQLEIPCNQGIVIDLKLLADSFWKLEDLGCGRFRLVHGNTKREEVPQCCQLLEVEVEDQLLQGPGDVWDDLILLWQTINTGVRDGLLFPLSELFLSRILQPGVFQQNLLRKVLEKHKRRIVESEFLTLTKDGLRKEILAAIEAESTGEGELQHLHQWKAFCYDYFVSWKDNNVPYGLLLDSSNGSIGVIRRQSFSAVRSLSDFEKLYYGGERTEAVVAIAKVDLQGSSNEADVLTVLHKCTGTISKHLGRMPLSVFQQALLGPTHFLLSHLSSVFLHVLDVGYDHSVLTHGTLHLGVDTARKKKLEYHQQQRTFELQMLLLLQCLRETGGSWERVLDIVGKYVDCFMQDMNVSISKGSSGDLKFGIINKKLVLKATAQVSRGHFEAARDLLLLLGYIINVKEQVGISPSEVSKIQLELIFQVRKVLLISLLVYWLTTSFADVPPPEDFSSHLSSLHIDGIIAAEKPWSRRLGTGELTLAEILMSAFPQTSVNGSFSNPEGWMSPDALLFNTKAFIHWLIWGDINDQQPSLSGLSGRSIVLSTILLQHGQYGVLEDFLNIIEDLCNQQQIAHGWQNLDGDWSTRLHLLGVCLLARARTSLKDALKEKQVGEAIRCFFRAASGLGEDKGVLQALFLQTGFQTTFPESAGHWPAAAWKLHYYEWVMQIFEQNNLNEGACQFAHAALEQVDEAVGNCDQRTMEMSNADSLASVIKGRLWANIFKFSLDLEHYSEAYCAIISNPDSESKYTCLRRLIIVLCERKATEVLCGSELPYAGMLERVEQELLWKAEYSDISANPSPYKLLYSFHMHRSNWRRAASYMYQYALRMRGGVSKAHLPVSFVLQEQLHGLVAAINALHLVDSVYAWIDTESDVLSSMTCRSSTKRLRVYADTDAGDVAPKSRYKNIDIEELEKEYTVTLAELLLVESNVKLNLQGGESLPADVLSLLVQSGIYEMAFSVLFRFWKDSSLKRELERIFRIMAERCCSQKLDGGRDRSCMALLESNKDMLSLTSSTELDPSCKVPISSEDTNVTTDVTRRCTWQSLQLYLEKYNRIHPGLPTVVAETMLSIDRLMELPVWLVDMFKGGRHASSQGMAGQGADPAALLCIYLDFGRFSEATFLLVDYLQAWAKLRPVDVIKRKRMCAVWFPYTLVDRLKLHLAELRKSDQNDSLQRLLDAALQRHLKQVQLDSNDVASLVQK